MTELYIGSHLSTAGGWNALLERSHEEGGTAFAFFPRSPYGKRSKPSCNFWDQPRSGSCRTAVRMKK